VNREYTSFSLRALSRRTSSEIVLSNCTRHRSTQARARQVQTDFGDEGIRDYLYRLTNRFPTPLLLDSLVDDLSGILYLVHGASGDRREGRVADPRVLDSGVTASRKRQSTALPDVLRHPGNQPAQLEHVADHLSLGPSPPSRRPPSPDALPLARSCPTREPPPPRRQLPSTRALAEPLHQLSADLPAKPSSKVRGTFCGWSRAE
jgi:hypothetical protein